LIFHSEELDRHERRLNGHEDAIHNQREESNVLCDRIDAHAKKIEATYSIASEVANVVMETSDDVSGLKERLAFLEQQMVLLPVLSPSLAAEEMEVIIGLRKMYLCLKMENVLDELSMKFSDGVYILHSGWEPNIIAGPHLGSCIDEPRRSDSRFRR
jgi:hypothetical protein